MSIALTLFDELNEVPDQQIGVDAIGDLLYVPDFLSDIEHDDLWREVNLAPWLSDIKRRVQHYGWRYDYKARKIDQSMFLNNFPLWAAELAEKLFKLGYIGNIPDQLIVNEYMPGQGIANHVDCKPCFTDTVISISLGSNCVMDFINLITKEKIELLLPPKSLVVIKGDSRYKWSHGITARKVDVFSQRKYERTRRISLTFRKVVIEEPQ
jgi:alkylated DNA repair dioxygenase AlkB